MPDFLLFCALSLAIIGTLIILILGIAGIYLICVGKFMRFSPPIPSSGKTKKNMLQDATAYLQQHRNLTVVDLGSGWGTLLSPLAHRFPQHQFIGYELTTFPYLFSRWRTHTLKNINFCKQDFFTADLSAAHVIFCFLLPQTMLQCQKQILPMLQKGTLLYVNRFPLPNIAPKRIESLGSDYETYYVYEI